MKKIFKIKKLHHVNTAGKRLRIYLCKTGYVQGLGNWTTKSVVINSSSPFQFLFWALCSKEIAFGIFGLNLPLAQRNWKKRRFALVMSWCQLCTLCFAAQVQICTIRGCNVSFISLLSIICGFKVSSRTSCTNFSVNILRNASQEKMEFVVQP